MGVPFVKLGMHPGMAATYLLPEVVGPPHARDLLLTGRLVDADEALRLGLVSRVIEPDVLLEEVLEAAAGIAATAPIASRLTKLALLDGGHRDLEAAVQWEAMAQPITLATDDLQEGIRASREKRAGRLPRPLRRRARAGRGGMRGGPRSPGDICLPLACPSTGRGPRPGPTLGSRAVAVNARVVHTCGQTCGQRCAQGADRRGEAPGRRLWRARPGRRTQRTAA